MPRNVLNFDELHMLTVYSYEDAIEQFPDNVEKRKEKVCDDVLSLLVMAYLMGMRIADEDLEFESELDSERMFSDIYKEIDGKDFEDRIKQYVEEEKLPEIIRVVETDSHRVYNDGEIQACDQYTRDHPEMQVMKTWKTMMDDRVRDTHDYLEGRTIPYSDLFYTYTGESAFAPGLFGVPEEDINCRCMLRFSKTLK